MKISCMRQLRVRLGLQPALGGHPGCPRNGGGNHLGPRSPWPSAPVRAAIAAARGRSIAAMVSRNSAVQCAGGENQEELRHAGWQGGDTALQWPCKARPGQ